MSERDLEKPGDKRPVIAAEIIGSDCGRYVITDPEAPSVAEVVEELRAERFFLIDPWMERMFTPDFIEYRNARLRRIDNLIARLEGAPDRGKREPHEQGAWKP